jgi:hypothetical protein
MKELLDEFESVKQLANSSQQQIRQRTLPTIVTKLYWFHGLEQRIKVEHFFDCLSLN